MNFDTLFYAIIAVVVLARLWSVLGQRNDGDQQRPNPFATRPPEKPDNQANGAGATSQPEGPDNGPIIRLARHAPESLAGGLERIRLIDSGFDEKQFLAGAKAAFSMIVEEFTKGDMTVSSRFLSPDVYARFKRAIDARVAEGQTMVGKVRAIREAETIAAKLDDAIASITVRFVSEQEIILRDRAGQIIGGEPGKAEEITDTWVFKRDLKSTDPNWLLIET